MTRIWRRAWRTSGHTCRRDRGWLSSLHALEEAWTVELATGAAMWAPTGDPRRRTVASTTKARHRILVPTLSLEPAENIEALVTGIRKVVPAAFYC